jgi:hypothetical protein
MNENSFFSITRTRYLLIRQLRFSTQSLLIGLGAVAGLIVFILSMQVIFNHSTLSSTAFLSQIIPFFFIGGYIFSSTIFSELRTPHRGYLYLTLPASTFEKLIVAWFISSVLYIAGAVVIIFLINVLLMVVAIAFSANQVPVFNLFEPPVVKMYAIYLVTQPIFVLGAIYFRRINFLKTLLSLFVISLIIAIYTSIAARLIVFHHFSSIHFDCDLPEAWQNFFENIFVPVIKILFWYCLAPFFLVVSYFRLKERQV